MSSSDIVEVSSENEALSKEGSSPKVNEQKKSGNSKPIPKKVTKTKDVEKKVADEVILIDLTDDSEDIDQDSSILIEPVTVKDLRDIKMQNVLKLVKSSTVMFAGNRAEDKTTGVLKLQLKKGTDKDKVIEALNKVPCSTSNEFSTQIVNGHCSDTEVDILTKLQADSVGGDVELTSVFVNNIPPETCPGILEVMFPSAVNIEFPQDNQGHSLGYAVLEIKGRKAAECLIKHHEQYIPSIGQKVFKLHIAGIVSNQPSQDVSSKESDEAKPKRGQEGETKYSIDDSPSKKTQQPLKITETSASKVDQSVKKAVPDDKKSIIVEPEKKKGNMKSNIRSTEENSSSKDADVKITKSESSMKNQNKQDKENAENRDEKTGTSEKSRRSHSKTLSDKGHSSSDSRSRSRHLSADRKERHCSRSRDRNVSSQRQRYRSSERGRNPRSPLRRRQDSDRSYQRRSDNSRSAERNGGQSPAKTMSRRTPDFPGRRSKWGMNREDNFEQDNSQSFLGMQNPLPGNSITGLDGPQDFMMNKTGPPWAPGLNVPRMMGPQNTPASNTMMPGQGIWVMGQSNQMAQMNTDSRPHGSGQQGMGQINPLMGQPNRFMGQNNQLMGQRPPMLAQGNQMAVHGSLLGKGPVHSTMQQGNLNQMAAGNMMGNPGNQMAAQRNQMMGSGNPMMSQGNQMMGSGNQMAAQRNQMMGSGNQVAAQRNQMMGSGNQMMSQGNQMMGSGNQMTGSGNQMMPQGNQMTGSGNQMMPQGNQMTGSGNQRIEQRNQMMGSGNQMMMNQGNQMIGQGAQMIGSANQTGQNMGMAQSLSMKQGNLMIGQRNQGRNLGSQVMDQTVGRRNQSTGRENVGLGRREQETQEIEPETQPFGLRNQSRINNQGYQQPSRRMEATPVGPVIGQGSSFLNQRSANNRQANPDSIQISDLSSEGQNFGRGSITQPLGKHRDNFRQTPEGTSQDNRGRPRNSEGSHRRPSRFDQPSPDLEVILMEQEKRPFSVSNNSRQTSNMPSQDRKQKDIKQTGNTYNQHSLGNKASETRSSSDRRSGYRQSSRPSQDIRKTDNKRDGLARSDRSRSPDYLHSHAMSRDNISKTEQQKRNQGRTRQSRFEEKGSVSVQPEQATLTQTNRDSSQKYSDDAEVSQVPDISGIRNQLLSQLRQLESGTLSDPSELADIANKLKQVQNQQMTQDKITPSGRETVPPHTEQRPASRPVESRSKQNEATLRGAPGRTQSSYKDNRDRSTRRSQERSSRFGSERNREKKNRGQGDNSRQKVTSSESVFPTFPPGKNPNSQSAGNYSSRNITASQTSGNQNTWNTDSQSSQNSRSQQSWSRAEDRSAFQSDGNFSSQTSGNFPSRTGGNFSSQTGGNFPSQSGGNLQSEGNFSANSGGNFSANSGGNFSANSGRYFSSDRGANLSSSGNDQDFRSSQFISGQTDEITEVEMEDVQSPMRSDMFGRGSYQSEKSFQGTNHPILQQEYQKQGLNQSSFNQRDSRSMMGAYTGNNNVPMQAYAGNNNVPMQTYAGNNNVPMQAYTGNNNVAIQERPKKVYVGNLPATARWDEIAKFFNLEMRKRRLVSPVSVITPVSGVVQAPDRTYAYVMFNTADEAQNAVQLDGIRYENRSLTVKIGMFPR